MTVRFVAIFLTMIGAAKGSGMEIVGHRGSSYEAPENTVASANLAWKEKADAVELDIFLTKDGQLAVLHDENLKRTTGLDRAIGEATMAEVKKLDAGSWKSPVFRGEPVPTLEEILATGPSAKSFFIEIKKGPEVVGKLRAVLDRAKLEPRQVVIISFDREAVAEARRAMPQYQAWWIVDFQRDALGRRPSLDETIRLAQAAGVNGLDLSAKWPIDAAFVRRVKQAGLSLGVWTVDDPELAHRLRAAGVEAITTNRPGWLRQQLEK